MFQTECPECGGDITFKSEPIQGNLVNCPDCGADLQVVNIDPVELGAAPDEDEDWGE